VCATGVVHTDIVRSIRYLPNPVPSRNQNGHGLWLQSVAAMPDPTTRSSPETRFREPFDKLRASSGAPASVTWLSCLENTLIF